MPSSTEVIAVAARASSLSQAQVGELLAAVHCYNPAIAFEVTAIETYGDRDRTTSLRSFSETTDFFTREVDAAVIRGDCRIAVHSAKDLPRISPLAIVAVTPTIDASDALVMAEGVTVATLPPGARVATSSKRREEAVCCIRSDCHFVDVRGAIEERLALLDNGTVDAVVIAEAALLRLGLSDRNRVMLPGATAALQGQLAVVARHSDSEMEALFAPLDTGDRP